ncbi:MAG: hypothetical protein HOJ94_05610 [Alphaproteobacteria bacterium]|jgi:hypothetical protein|nr:hypothetical protein [Alphaproteobacteria bacterium]
MGEGQDGGDDENGYLARLENSRSDDVFNNEPLSCPDFVPVVPGFIPGIHPLV